MRSLIVVLALIFVVFAIGDSKNVNQKYAETITKVSKDVKATFAHEFKQGSNVTTFAQNANNCWVCSSPCSMIYCCDDGYPQCCVVGGYCACCSH
ncbi:unnamed protein product [Medioppia subpectinata]|uniref:Uncharacterized protein n=1 Tax=Medioppia subpectinata TaxID=1979941 RepID=A0A7R9LBZ8_9ACAR|nr:unnamed protein product [Medioppia subpectinata]CAG2117620.1 unnamed protein product [Medioppia subpectinata]